MPWRTTAAPAARPNLAREVVRIIDQQPAQTAGTGKADLFQAQAPEPVVAASAPAPVAAPAVKRAVAVAAPKRKPDSAPAAAREERTRVEVIRGVSRSEAEL